MKYALLSALLLSVSLTITSTAALAHDEEEWGHQHSDHHKWGHHWEQDQWMRHLHLSDQQKAQIKAIHAEHKAEIKSTQEALMEAKKAMMSAILKGDASTDSLKILSNQLGEAASQMALVRANMIQKELQVLTPEQRQNLQDKSSRYHHEHG